MSAVDFRCTKAYYLSWLFNTKSDRKRSFRAFARFFEDIRRYDDNSALFTELVRTDSDRQNFAEAFRRSIASRHAIDSTLNALLALFAWAFDHASLRQAFENNYVEAALPVLWICKAMQKQLCSGVDEYNYAVLQHGLMGIMCDTLPSSYLPFSQCNTPEPGAAAVESVPWQQSMQQQKIRLCPS